MRPPSARPAPQAPRLSLALLVLGVLAGAAAGLGARWLVRAAQALPPDVVAQVNHVLIRRLDYERLLERLASDRREPLSAADRQHVLTRLIDEELLLQYGIARGIARTDPTVRADLVAAVTAMIGADAQDAQPAAAELRSFYEAQGPRFVQPGPVHARQIFFRVAAFAEGPAALARAQDAAARLRAGQDYGTVRATLGDPELTALPDDWVTADRLRDILGPTVSRTVETLAVGGVSDPIRSGTGFHVVQLLARQADAAPPLDQIQAQVLAEYRRHAAERALRAYLDDLRARAEIERGDPAAH